MPKSVPFAATHATSTTGGVAVFSCQYGAEFAINEKQIT